MRPAGAVGYGNKIDELIIEDVRARRLGNSGGAAAFTLNGIRKGRIENVDLCDPTGLSTSLLIDRGNRDLVIRNFRGRGQGSGIVVAPDGTGNPQIHDVLIEGARLNGGIYTRPSYFAPSTATFTASTIEDTSRNFSTSDYVIGQQSWEVRIFNGVDLISRTHVRGTTTAPSDPALSPFTITAGGGTPVDFTGIPRGSIVDTDDGRRAFLELGLNGSAYVREWYDKTTFEVIDGPPSGVVFRVYKTVYGLVTTTAPGRVSNTKLAADRGLWHDTLGNPVTPVDGSVYEMCPTLGYAGILLGGPAGSRQIKVVDCYVRESGSDAIACYEPGSQIIDCTAEDNDDQSFTVTITPSSEGRATIVRNCKAINAGRGGRCASTLETIRAGPMPI